MTDALIGRFARIGLLVAACSAALGVGGCVDSEQGFGYDPEQLDGDQGDDENDNDGDGDGGPESTDGDPASGPGAGMVGAWGQLLSMSVIQSGVPLIGSSWAASRNWYLVEVTTDGQGNLTATERLCAIKIKLGTWVDRSVVPQGFVDSLAPLERHVSVASIEPGSPWISDQVIEVRGANLCDGECDPELSLSCDRLPPTGSADGPDDAPSCEQGCSGSQCDQDDDDHPGMTTILSGMFNCELYVAQRWGAALAGEIIDQDTVDGAVVDNFSEQSLLASSSPFCATEDPEAVPEDCPEHQYFKMVRLPHGATCADVLALTDCDEDDTTCDVNEVLPLDPKNDLPGDCD